MSYENVELRSLAEAAFAALNSRTEQEALEAADLNDPDRFG